MRRRDSCRAADLGGPRPAAVQAIFDDGSVAVGPPYEADIDRWVNGEAISNHDVVIWYGAHFTHDVNHDGPAQPQHIVGPDLKLMNW